MDARTQRTLLRLGASLLVLVVAFAIVELTHDDTLRVGGIGLAAAAILSIEEWLRNSGSSAAPSVDAVNLALVQQSTVPPPKVNLQK